MQSKPRSIECSVAETLPTLLCWPHPSSSRRWWRTASSPRACTCWGRRPPRSRPRSTCRVGLGAAGCTLRPAACAPAQPRLAPFISLLATPQHALPPICFLAPSLPSPWAAYFGDDLPPEAVEVVAAAAPGEGLAEVRARLDRIYRQPAASTSGSRCAGCQGGAMRWPHRHHLHLLRLAGAAVGHPGRALMPLPYSASPHPSTPTSSAALRRRRVRSTPSGWLRPCASATCWR